MLHRMPVSMRNFTKMQEAYRWSTIGFMNTTFKQDTTILTSCIHLDCISQKSFWKKWISFLYSWHCLRHNSCLRGNKPYIWEYVGDWDWQFYIHLHFLAFILSSHGKMGGKWENKSRKMSILQASHGTYKNANNQKMMKSRTNDKWTFSKSIVSISS